MSLDEREHRELGEGRRGRGELDVSSPLSVPTHDGRGSAPRAEEWPAESEDILHTWTQMTEKEKILLTNVVGGKRNKQGQAEGKRSLGLLSLLNQTSFPSEFQV